jgi:hypothetical protein
MEQGELAPSHKATRIDDRNEEEERDRAVAACQELLCVCVRARDVTTSIKVALLWLCVV